jgi:hypothetical protein
MATATRSAAYGPLLHLQSKGSTDMLDELWDGVVADADDDNDSDELWRDEPGDDCGMCTSSCSEDYCVKAATERYVSNYGDDE